MRRNRLRGRIAREHVLLVGLAVLVALAGCSGASSDGTPTETPVDATPTETPVEATPDGTPADTTPEESPDGEPETDDSATNVTFRFGQTLPSGVEPVNGSVTTDDVIAAVTAATDGVETYRFTANVTTTTETNNVERTQYSLSRTAVNRTRPALRSNMTVSVAGQTIRQQTYLVDGTFYQHSERLVQRYNSEWIRRNLSDNVTEQFTQRDELVVQRRVLTNGSTTLDGIQRVDGERTYRLRTEVNQSSYAEVYGLADQNLSVSDVRMVVVTWVDTETGDILRSEGKRVLTTANSGRQVRSVYAWDETFDYEPVDITLPDAAKTAVTVGN